MCNVSRNVVRVTERPERMFKVARPTPATGVFISQWPPLNRSTWEKEGAQGSTATYIIGEETKASFDTGPGICLFPTKEQAEREIESCIEHNGMHRTQGLALLEVEISSCTPLRYDSRYDVYAAPAVMVKCVHLVRQVTPNVHSAGRHGEMHALDAAGHTR